MKILAKIPTELKTRPQWVCWAVEDRDGKPTKVPKSPRNGGNSRTDAPATWGTYDQAVKYWQAHQGKGVAGIGFVFSADDPYTGIDLDKCRDPETGEVEPWAREIITRLNSYTEISPSGRGVHVLVKANLPPGGNRKGHLEMYGRGRYFTMTGLHLEGTPTTIENRQQELEVLHAKIFSQAQPKTPNPSSTLSLSDQELINRAHQAANGEKFARLWRGDLAGHPSPSEATAALLNHLCFWCGRDPERIDWLFRQSGLMRQKWDRPQAGSTWGALEVQKAMSRATEFYSPGQAPEGHQRGQAEPEIKRIFWVGYFYCIKGGRLCWAIYDGKDGAEYDEKNWQYRPLANFQASISEEITRDDGLKRSKEFQVTGRLDTGKPLAPALIPATEFDGLKWIAREWGAAAAPAPGRTLPPHLVTAVKAHSQGFKRRTVFAHTGWRQVGGEWRYLHGGGAIGPGEDVEIDLGENLGLYRLPAPGGLEAAKASLNFLEIGPWEVTAPLLACAYLAPFADLLKIDFSLWLYGPTGSFKSTLAALALCHFGQFDRRTLPGSWFSTVNSLEKLCFTLKDSLVVIDDFMPAASAKDSHHMTEKAGRLLYQVGNRSGRGRLAPDLKARPNYHPRGLIISTGEVLLPGQRQSATARYLGVELDPKKTPIDLDRLTAAQAEAHLYAGAMAAFLVDLPPRLEEAQENLKALWDSYRGVFRGKAHLRVPEIQAWLAVGFEYFLRFQSRMGTITEDQAYQMLNKAWEVFVALGEAHARRIEGERPTLKFLSVLTELFLTSRVYAESKDKKGLPPPAKASLGWEGDWQEAQPAKNAYLVGFADDSMVYLMPNTAMRAVNSAIRDQGDYLSLGQNELWAALAREGLIIPGQGGRTTRTVRIQGGVERVLCLPLENLIKSEGEDEE